MKKSVLLAGLLFLLPLAAGAQNTPKGELALGYSLLRFSTERTTTHGWDAAIAANINSNLAVVFDFAGHYGSFDEKFLVFHEDDTIQTHSFLIGPRVFQTVHNRWMPFAQLLLGVARTNVDGSISVVGKQPFLIDSDTRTGFAMTAGGGLDLIANPKVAIRLFQAEYTVHHFPDVNGKSEGARIGAGIVFRFGSR